MVPSDEGIDFITGEYNVIRSLAWVTKINGSFPKWNIIPSLKLTKITKNKQQNIYFYETSMKTLLKEVKSILRLF